MQLIWVIMEALFQWKHFIFLEVLESLKPVNRKGLWN